MVALNYHGGCTTPHTDANWMGVSATFEAISNQHASRLPASADISGTCLLRHIKRLTCIMHIEASTANGRQRTGKPANMSVSRSWPRAGTVPPVSDLRLRRSIPQPLRPDVFRPCCLHMILANSPKQGFNCAHSSPW